MINKNWNCICGNFIRDKRYCPRCKLVRFTIQRPMVLSYDGYQIGQVTNNIPFLLPHEIIENHILISGQTATGKSSFAMNLITKMENTKFLIMDIEGEWKNIIPHLKGKTEYYAVDKNLKINPFDLNDSGLVRELLKQTVFSGIDKEYSDLSAQMNYVLQDTIIQSNSMMQLIQNIKEYENSKLAAISKTKTALLVRLNPFLHSPLREIFYCDSSNPEFAKLDKSNIIIDLHTLDAKVAYGTEIRLIYNVITMYYLRKMLSRGTSHRVANLFVADEAQLLVPRILKKLLVTDSWHATTFATRLHKRGCALLLITQSPSNIEQDIYKNIATKISFRLQSQEDIRLIADSAGFTNHTELEYLTNHFINLPQRNAIVSTIGIEPFLVCADEFKVTKYTPNIDTANITKEIYNTVEKKPILSDEQRQFLNSIKENPFVSVIHRRNQLGWSSKKYAEITRQLQQNKTITLLKASTGRGNPKTLYQRTGAIPSVKHEYYVDWICSRLKKLGIATRRNKLSGADIEVTKLDTAIEVELGKSNMDGNISKDGQKFSKVIVCSDQDKVIQTLNRRDLPSNVWVCRIHDVVALIQKMQHQMELEDC